MSKFCSNCGAQADDTAAVCGNCGTPFELAADPAPTAAANIADKLKKLIVSVVAIVVVLALVFGGIKIFQSFGPKGAVRKALSAGMNGKAEKLASVISIKYGEKEKDRKKAAKNLDFYLTESNQKKYKISYKIKDVKDLPSDELEKIQENIAEKFDKDEDYVSDAKIVKVQVTVKNKVTKENAGMYKGDYSRITRKVIITKEDGKWKFYGYYYGDDDDDD